MITATPRRTRSSLRAQRASGFSLIELMVGMALSVLLLGGVITIFVSSKASYESTERLSRIQENGRFALDELTRSIRSAGFNGCARSPTFVRTVLWNTATLQWNYLGSSVLGYQWTGSTWSPALPTGITGGAAPANGSDVLILRTPARNAEPMRLSKDLGTGAAAIEVDPTTNGVRAGDVGLIFSCEAQTYFYISGVTNGTPTIINHAATPPTPAATVGANVTDTVFYPFRENASVIPMQTVVYFVRASTSTDVPAGTTSLFRRINFGTAEELVEGVEQMQLRFGVDSANDTIVDKYVDANAADWNKVYSVNVGLLVRSLTTYNTDRDKRSYEVLNVTAAAQNDGHMREVFTTTAVLRNRQISH